MNLSTSSNFTTTPHPTHSSLPRNAPSRGLRHTTIIIIAVSASVGGLLLTIFFWRILSRLRRPKSAPFPPRQALVHQRELQLAAFIEHKNASVPQLVPDDVSSTPASQGSDSALLPNAHDWSANTSNRASAYTLETDEGVEVGRHLHPPAPHFFPPRTPHSTSASSSSLPSSNDNSSPSSDAATPPTPPFSTSTSPSQSFRRKPNRSGLGPRPTSMVSIGTHMTARSRQSVRAAPHAPHSNVQIVLPAPLAPNLYEETMIEGSRVPRQFVRDTTYSDTWRRSLVDSWISVGQHDVPEPEPMERRDSVERRSRLTRRGSSPGPFPPRSRSNPSPLSHLHPFSGPPRDLPKGIHPPVPRVPSEYGTITVRSPSAPPQQGASLSPSTSSTGSHKLRS